MNLQILLTGVATCFNIYSNLVVLLIFLDLNNLNKVENLFIINLTKLINLSFDY